MKTAAILSGSVLCVYCATAGVIAEYNFNGRTDEAKGISRIKIDGKISNGMGPEYVPNKEKGESGPVLKNPCSNSEPYYGSYYINEDGKGMLEQRSLHPHHRSNYQSAVAAGDEPLKSFTWDIVIMLSGAAGITGGNRTNITPIMDNGQEQLMVFNIDKTEQTFNLMLRSGKKDAVVEKLKLNQFLRITVTASNECDLYLYIDGEKKAELMAPAAPSRLPGFGFCGWVFNTPIKINPGSFYGKVDRLTIYDNALTADEVNKIPNEIGKPILQVQ